jgi:hypothetical protein
MHFTSDPELKRKHFPTGRVSLESFIQFLIRDYGVQPIEGRGDALAANRRLFEKYRTWA